MSSQNKTVSVRIDSFSGTDADNSSGTAVTTLPDNFRILPDGTLQKRYGYAKQIGLPGAPTATVFYKSGQSYYGYAIINRSLYSISLTDNSFTPLCEDFMFMTENASMVLYKGYLLISDGGTIYLYYSGNISPAVGYTPLYGKDWDPTTGGAVNERLNMFSNRYRISYRITDSISQINLPITAQDVILVEINGVELDSTQYSYDPDEQQLTSSAFAAGTTVTVWVCSSLYFSHDQTLGACRRALTAECDDDTVLFCYASVGESYDTMLFRSTPVSTEQLNESRRHFYHILDLYIPCDIGMIMVDNGCGVVTSVLRYDSTRVLVFTETKTWFVPLKSDFLTTELLSETCGCSSPGATAMCEEYPVSICGNDVFIWKFDEYQKAELLPFCITETVRSLLPSDFSYFGQLFVNSLEKELWFYTDSSSAVLVYNYESNQWYGFSGFDFSNPFIFDFKLGFIDGADICLFSQSYPCDLPDGSTETAIAASYTGGWQDFGLPGHIKRAKFAVVCAETGGGSIGLTLEFDSGYQFSNRLTAGNPDAPDGFVSRLPVRRFSFVRYMLSATGTESQRIRSLTLTASVSDNPKKR